MFFHLPKYKEFHGTKYEFLESCILNENSDDYWGTQMGAVEPWWENGYFYFEAYGCYFDNAYSTRYNFLQNNEIGYIRGSGVDCVQSYKYVRTDKSTFWVEADIYIKRTTEECEWDFNGSFSTVTSFEENEYPTDRCNRKKIL